MSGSPGLRVCTERCALFTSMLTALEQSCLSQHRNPVAFFQTLEKQGIWRLLWPTRLAILVGGLFLLPATLVMLTGERWVLLTAVVATCVFLLVSGAFMIVASPIAGSQPFLWIAYLFLYHFSLPFLVVVLLCALAPLTTVGLWLGWYSGLPWLLGVALADACALAVHQSARQTRAQWAYRRKGGPSEELPELRLWQWAGLIRLCIVLLLVVSAIGIAWLYGWVGMGLVVMLLWGAIGCARLEATLLAHWGWPLIQQTENPSCWRATYVGRSALWVETTAVLRTLQAAPSEQAAAMMVFALVQEGNLHSIVRRACVRLAQPTRQTLLLQLSLVDGGATLLRFLQTKLPAPACQRLAQLYATLASEAAKPLDLQRWLARLPEPQQANELAAPADITAVLVHTREALLQYQDLPIVTSAARELDQLVQQLYLAEPSSLADLPPLERLSWPLTLKRHLQRHRQQLAQTNQMNKLDQPITSL